MIENLKNKNIHIIGVSGAEGSAIALFLASQKCKKLTAHDFCEKKDFSKNFFSFHDALALSEKEKIFKKLKRSPIKFNFKEDYLRGIKQADLIFVPQSWFRYPENEPLFKLRKKIKFCNITKLYFDLCHAPIIAVTGTSGKSTTARLIYEILKKERRGETYFSGNDRENIQILDKIFNIKREDALVLEISNRQLKINLGKSPYIGVLTNISPNHLDDHKSFSDYVLTKASLFKYQTKKNFAVLNYDNQFVREIADEVKSQVYFFSRRVEIEQGAFLKNNEIIIRAEGCEYKICSVLDLKLIGPHNIENVLAASLASFLFGINTKIIRRVVTNFRGLKSRLELVREYQGVRYYEDSSACNFDGLKAAIKSFKCPIILIAGGERKKIIPSEFDELAQSIIESKVKALFLIGKKAKLIFQAIKKKIHEYKKPGPIIKICKDLKEAVQNSYKSAQDNDVVILSPGCESFDMFLDYRDRGRKFKRLVKNLPY